jgi:uncharacterized protein
MRKIATFFIFISITLFTACTSDTADIGEEIRFSIQSDETEAEYKIVVILPVDYDLQKSYDTIYLLDKNWYLKHTSQSAAKLSQQKRVDNVVIVGIGHGHTRSRDYTPTESSQGKGGAEAFSFFVEQQIIPEIENRFSVNRKKESRAILGHSLGGLYAAYTFVMQSQLFGTYLILSPSLWYDDGIILELEESSRAELHGKNANLFLSRAELEPTQLFMKLFLNRIHDHYPNVFSVDYIVKGKNHSSSADESIEEAIRFLFNTTGNS